MRVFYLITINHQYIKQTMDYLFIAIAGLAGLIIGGLITATLLRKAVEKKADRILPATTRKLSHFLFNSLAAIW